MVRFRRRIRVLGAGALVCATLAVAGCAPSPDGSRGPVDAAHCVRQAKNVNRAFGPTDVSATTGNGGLSVAINDHGTITAMRWPSPSFYDQIKFLTTDERQPLSGALPNEGAFSGVRLEHRDRSVTFSWLRDLDVSPPCP